LLFHPSRQCSGQPPRPLLPFVTRGELGAPKRPYVHLVHDHSVPDSGYALVEEDDEIAMSEDGQGNEALELLRTDEFERAFAIKWLIGFAAWSDIWISSVPEPETEACTTAIDEAAALLSLFAGSEPEQAITRNFSFPTQDGPPVDVELNDAPLLSEDHTSVGLQSWASSILLAGRLCANPGRFNLEVAKCGKGLRVLELGAGTGLLSIETASRDPTPQWCVSIVTILNHSLHAILCTGAARDIRPSPVYILVLSYLLAETKDNGLAAAGPFPKRIAS
jgi:hypothetical protein